MIKFIFSTTLFLLALMNTAKAVTWDEPWQDSVIAKADCFVLAKIGHVNKHKGVKLHILKTLAGQEISGTVKVDDFYLLSICSFSTHGPEFYFPKGECYFFLKKTENNTYAIASPSAGFDYIEKNKVYGTYRISIDKCIIPIEVYERTMTAIFNRYHNVDYDVSYMINFVTLQLNKKPFGYSKEEINGFYLQHAALECIYHLKLPGYYNLILPFFNDTSNYHSQISAARALSAYNSDECKQLLLTFIADTSQPAFAQTMCVNSLAYFKPIALKAELTQLKEKASNKDLRFGVGIMDPRVCTYVPSPQRALANLLKTL